MTRKLSAVERLIPAAFFLSGFSGLIYEVVWERWLELIFGVGIYAATTVVVSFMSGLAAGSLVFGRLADRSRRPLRLYAFLELGVGACALALPVLLPLVGRLYALHPAALFALSFLLLLPPTMMMGGTLPVLCRSREPLALGRTFSLLYGINTLGGVAGCLFSGFWLISRFGVGRTNAIAAATTIAIGAAMLALARGRESAAPEERGAETPGPAPAGARAALLALVALSGFAGLGYEMLWFRALRMMIGGTVYAFNTTLTTFLVGLGLGSLLAGGLEQEGVLVSLGAAEAAAGALALATFPLFPAIGTLLRPLSGAYFAAARSWLLARALHFAIAGTVMLVPGVFLGMILPLAARALVRREDPPSSQVGRLYFLNTAGGILGALAFGFFLIPRLGLRRSAFALGSLSLALAAAAFALALRERRRGGALAAAVPAALLAAVFLGAKGLTDKPALDPSTLYRKDGLVSTVRVWTDGSRKYLETDNLNVQGTDVNSRGGQPKRLGYLPFLIQPKTELAGVLQIGLGTGINLSALAESPARSVDVVELIPELPEALRFFARENGGVLSNPKVHLTIGDGRNYVLASREKYDLIVADLFFPEQAGAGSLYSLEHFLAARRLLTPGGAMVQWIPLHQVSMDDLKVIVNTFGRAFPHESLWWGTFSAAFPVVGLVGSDEPQSVDPDVMREKMKLLSPGLRATEWEDPRCVMSSYVLGDGELRRFGSGAALNTDDAPYIEFHAPRVEGRGRGLAFDNIYAVASLMGGGAPASGPAATPALRRDVAAMTQERAHLLKALVWRAAGNPALFARERREAAAYGRACAEFAGL